METVVVSGATLDVSTGPSSGVFPSSVLGLVAQAPMVVPAAAAVATAAAAGLLVGGGGGGRRRRGGLECGGGLAMEETVRIYKQVLRFCVARLNLERDVMDGCEGV